MSVIYDKISTRDAFGIALGEAADEYDNLFAIGADTTKSMGFKPMMEKYPNRVINNGIALIINSKTSVCITIKCETNIQMILFHKINKSFYMS